LRSSPLKTNKHEFFQSKADEVNLRIGSEAKKFALDKIEDKDLRRKLKLLRDLGVSALSEEKLKRY